MKFFSEKDEIWIEELLSKYPENHAEESALIPLLHYTQEKKGGWLAKDALEAVAERLGLKISRVMEVATFYSQFHLKEVGKTCLNICTTTPCWLMGSDDLLKQCEEKFGVKKDEVTPDGSFSFHEVECLGACSNAPVAMIKGDYYEDLTKETFDKLLCGISGKGTMPEPGSKRKGSKPKEKE